MRDNSRTTVAKTTLTIPSICFGTSALGDMPDTYGYGVDEARARDTLNVIFDHEIGFLDTSRNYGAGRSDARVQQTIDWANHQIPEALWTELSALPFDIDDPEAKRVYKPN